MVLVTTYDTPGGLRDVPSGSAFYTAWHDFVNGEVSNGPGPPWIDPVASEVDIATARTLSWIGFPRATLTVDNRDTRDEAFSDAEDPGLPGQDGRPRQLEYFEWFTTRKAGKVTKVAFTTETPQYFELLAAEDPDRVLELYREHVDPAIEWKELIRDDGRYDRHNVWTTTRGLMHYVNGVNELNQALLLAKQGAELSLDSKRDNFAILGRTKNAADDYIWREVAALGRAGFDITVDAHVALYLDGWDDTGWTKPDGSPVGNYWRIVRGKPGAVVRLEYEVPEEEGFVVGDIQIGGRSVRDGGQLAEHMTSSLPVVVARRAS